ncbi:MAG: type II toxin-antitoxin system HicB family antitoxin [Clostridiales bacterium]|jgi:predicted RNase H-like HicB family nuclease|nr:type II toxin-antitoxin system HicB family antitoxin [Clostridiales bacterium]
MTPINTLSVKTQTKDINIPIFRILIHPCEEGGYWAECPEIQGCLTEGKTLKEIEVNMFEAVDVSLPDIFPDVADYTLEFEVQNA